MRRFGAKSLLGGTPFIIAFTATRLALEPVESIERFVMSRGALVLVSQPPNLPRGEAVAVARQEQLAATSVAIGADNPSAFAAKMRLGRNPLDIPPYTLPVRAAAERVFQHQALFPGFGHYRTIAD